VAATYFDSIVRNGAVRRTVLLLVLDSPARTEDDDEDESWSG
jgi:hypothetical protein